MIRIEQNNTQWLEFELLAECPEVMHGVFTRHGGCSKGHLAGLNLNPADKAGDNPENVTANLEKIKQALALSNILSGIHCHGAAIAEVTPSSFDEIIFCDGLTTQSRNIGLMIRQADCQAAIFYDPVHQALANVHCGWRGSVKNIYNQAVLCMRAAFQSRPEDMLVCISPSLGPENAEFINYRQELPESFWDFQVKANYFDFWAISEWQLQQSGILPHHIQIARIDTFANADDYFSYRRSKPCGNHATICALS
jgi:polyphenol oxidase